MLKFKGDPRTKKEVGCDIPTVDELQEVLRPATAAVIWQIMRGDRHSGIVYRGDEADQDKAYSLSSAKRKAHARRIYRQETT